MWPAVITVVVILGVALIVFSRSERGSATTEPPRLGDHVHAAYGVYDCTQFLPPLQDAKQDTLGIHTHGDGLIHIHPFSSSVTGKRATLKAFADQTGMKITDDRITLPTGKVLEDGDKCGGKTAQVEIAVWDNPGDSKPTIHTTGLADLHLGENQLYVIALVPSGTTLPKPPSLSELAAPSDLAPTATTVPGETVPATPGSTPPTTPGSTPPTSAPAGSAPPTSSP